MNHKPTRDLLGEPAYYSERELFAAVVSDSALVIALLVVAVLVVFFWRP